MYETNIEKVKNGMRFRGKESYSQEAHHVCIRYSKKFLSEKKYEQFLQITAEEIRS